MSKEKQIEEMACKNCIHYRKCVDTFRTAQEDGEVLLITEDEYFANANGCDFYADKRIYRKQSDWISVDERLPECTMLCLVHCVHSYCDYDGYCNITIKVFANGEFGIEKAYKVTHWMPLPEAPKMKGGDGK